MKCKIIFERDPKTLKVTDKIKAVKAPNGQKSILFDDIRNQVVDDKLSLETYYKTYTDEFKDKVKGVGKDKNDEVIFEEVKDIILPSRMLASVGDKNWDLININGWLNHLRDFIKSDNDKTKSYASNLHLPNIKRMMDELITDSTNRINRVVNDVTKILSKHTDKDTIQSITDLIKTEDLDNIELVKQLIIPIVDKSAFYSNNSGNVENEISNMIDELSNILDVIDDIYMVKDDELSNLNSEVQKLSNLVNSIRNKYNTYTIPDLLKNDLTADERDIVNKELAVINKWRNRANQLKDLNKSKFNDTVNKLKDYLSNYTDSETVDSIIQYIVRSDYELQSKDNIELAKQLIKGIIDNPGLYSSSDVSIDSKFKGKIVYALPGTGKSVAQKQSEDIVDLDEVEKQLTGTSNVIDANKAYDLMSSTEKVRHESKQQEIIDKALSENKTVITSRRSMIDKADYIIMHNDSDRLSDSVASKERENVYNYSKDKSEKIIDLASKGKGVKIILKPGEYVSDILFNNVKPGVDYVFEQNKELAKIGSKQEYSDYLSTIFPDSKVKDIVYRGDSGYISVKDRLELEEGSKVVNERKINTGVFEYDNIIGKHDIAKEFTFENGKKRILTYKEEEALSPRPFKRNEFDPIDYDWESGGDSMFGMGFYFHSSPDNMYYDRARVKYQTLINVKNPLTNVNMSSKLNGVTLYGLHPDVFKKEGYDGVIGDVSNGNELVVFEPSQIHVLGSTKDIAQFSHYIKTRKASTSSGNQSNNIRSKYFPTGDTQSHKDILQKIVDNTDENKLGPLAKRMLQVSSGNIPITLKPVTYLFEFTDDNGVKSTAAGAYYNRVNKIEIAEFANMKGGGVPTLIHEILHGYTAHEIERNTINAKELREIYNEVLKYKSSISNKYRISNLDEFIVGIFTDSQFMKELQQIPSIYPERHQSIWEDVLQWFKNLLKTNSKEASLLDDAFYVATKIIMDHSNNTKEKEEYVWTDDEGNPLASPSDPADTQIEDQFKLRNEDGSRKRYTENKALELARKLNKANPDRPFKFTVIKIMGEKGDNRVYHAIKVIPREDKLFSLSDADYKGQPQITQPDSIKLDIDAFQAMVGPNGYSTDQMAIMEVYNRNTEGMMVEKKDVLVSDLPDKKLRETYEKKGVKVVKRYKTKDGYILYRVSDRQDMIKVAGMTPEKAQEQENNPKSVLARQRGTEMHDLNQRILEMLVNSNNPAFGIDPYRQLDFNLWFGDGVTPGAFDAFKLTDEYKQLQKEGRDIFDNRSDTDASGDTYKISDSTKQVDKLVKSMMRLYHQVHLIQKDINVKNNTNHKPIFLTETVLVDKGANEAGTMDIAVIFSDGTASIYDHKFTDLQAVQFTYPKDKAKQDWAEIKRIRTAQGLPVNDTHIDSQAWYYTLPDHIDLYKREDSWNAQIGRYSEMLTKLYGVKSIRQARILPVATSYTKVDKEFTPASKVAVILTGDDDFGISQIALEVEKTGDVALDRFIQMLLANKHALAKERLEKKAYDDPKYNERIRKLDASIQALLLSRDVTKIADSIQALADQIQLDLNNVEPKISFTDIINHLKEIEMYESFIGATAGELDAMKEKYDTQIKKGEVNPYTTFIQRLGVAKAELGTSAEKMHTKMTSMIYEENEKGNFMSSNLFKSFEKQIDMSALGKVYTHLREVNHPIVSLFSQLLDKVATNRLNERRDLEVKINELNKELSKWGERKGLKGPAVYKSILDEKTLNLIHKFKHYVKEDFKDHLDQKNHKDNIKWFKENFHRTGANEEKFQARLKLEKESINKTAKSEQEKYERLEKWLDANDVNYKDGDNKAWYNQYVQYWLTPRDPEEYYTDQYKELLKPENTPMLDFYNFYTNHMVELSKKVDFKVSETMVAEIRKDTIDTMVQDGIFAGWKQQGHNMFNYFSKHDKDDGFQTIDDGTKNGKKVPIFFTDSVGVENKSFDLAKSLMIYSDFVNNYSGVKDMEHAVLAMRELVSKTRGVKTNWKGQVGRNAAGEIDLKEGPNEKLLEAFDKWINYYIYGETKEGDPFQNKVVDAMTSVSSRKSVALNFLSAVGGHINAAAQLDMIASKAFQFDDKILKAGRKEAERFKLFRETMGKGKDATEALDSKSMFANFFFEVQQDDQSYEKANSVSLSTLRKIMSKDYAFILQRWSDHVIDSTTLNAMLMSYGIDPNTGKTYPIKRLQEMYANDPKYKDLEWKSLWDSLDLENKDKDGNKQPIFINQHDGTKMSDATYTDFRRKAKHLISKAKGNMSSEDIAGYRTHMIGRLVMQFRGWIPATVRERVKGEQYSLTMEQFEVGRWIAAYEMVGKNLKSTAGEFIKQMLPFVKGDFNKNMNDPLHPMKVKYEQYIADNPHLKPDPLNPAPEHITYEQYYNTYVGEVKALAREVQTYLALAGFLGLMMFAAGDDELKENPLLRLATALCERTQLEIGFYVPVFGATEQYQLLARQPVSSLSLLADAAKAVTNTGTEMYDTIMGAGWNKTVTPKLGDDSWELDYTSRNDASTWGYYSHQFIPPVNFLFNVFEPLNITDRKDTVYDYLLDNSTMVYRY